MSRAIAHPGLVYRVSPRQRPTRITCVSSGTTKSEGDTRVHTPRSNASRRTIQRRNRLSRLQALPADGRGKKYQTPGRRGTRPYALLRSSARVRLEKLSMADAMSVAAPSPTKNPSIVPERSSICLTSHSRAAISRPRVQRCTRPSNAPPSRCGSNRRTNSAGWAPTIAISRSIVCRTLATRPNASDEAKNATTSRSSGRSKRRTIWIGIGRRIRIVEAGVEAIEFRLEFGVVDQSCNPAILQSCNSIQYDFPCDARAAESSRGDGAARRRRARWRVRVSQTFAARSGRHADGGRHFRARRHRARRRRDHPYLRINEARRVLRPWLRTRPGPPLADGVSAPRRPRTAVRDLRRGDHFHRSISQDARHRTRGPGGLGRAAARRASRARTPTSPASTPSSPRITAAACRRNSRSCGSSPSRGADPTSWRG